MHRARAVSVSGECARAPVRSAGRWCRAVDLRLASQHEIVGALDFEDAAGVGSRRGRHQAGDIAGAEQERRSEGRHCDQYRCRKHAAQGRGNRLVNSGDHCRLAKAAES